MTKPSRDMGNRAAMARLDPPIVSPGVRRRRRLLSCSGLAAVLTALAGAAQSQSIGALMAATHQAMPSAAPGAAPSAVAVAAADGMAAAAARALQYQTQVNSAANLAQQAQAAAQAAARALNQNATAGVVDGLGLGGLQPAVAAVTPLTADPTAAGLATWQGAQLPTASASSPNNVTIVQTDRRAVLSWTTFNVGQNTTLTFHQQLNGVAQPGWVALNRVVGQLDPATGLRNPMLSPTPSQILGAIKADGTVLVINQNGVIFGPTSQVNTQAFVTSTLEIGRASDPLGAGLGPRTIAQRDAEFLEFGLLGYAETNVGANIPMPTFSAQDVAVGTAAHPGVAAEPNLEGAIAIDRGASLTSADDGYVAMLGPKVVNAGALASPDGEVALQSGRAVTFQASSGDANSVDPDVRGLVVTGLIGSASDRTDYVENTGSIDVERGYVSLGATAVGAVIDSGFITSTTSIQRNGFVNIFGGDIQISPEAVIAIGPDNSAQTIPQDPASVGAFRPSRVRIGDTAARTPGTPGSHIDIGANSLIYAPGGDITIGADPGADGPNDTGVSGTSSLFIDTGAVIDAAGLPDVVVPASRNSIKIDPVKGNELANAPAFRNGFLNGATVYLDPRLSGVSANGVAWVGSPLIAAAAFAQQVGIGVSELMTRGGDVTLGALSYSGAGPAGQAPDVVVKPGAIIDVGGGWKSYQAGQVVQSNLINAAGEVAPISQANPEGVYIGLYTGYTVNEPRWGMSQTYVDPLLVNSYFEPQYAEGADAGSLTIKASVVALDGQVFASAFAGPMQIIGASPGTASGQVYGDARKLQAAPSQLPAGGYLNVQALDLTGLAQSFGSAGGGDIQVVDQAAYAPLAKESAPLTDGAPLVAAADGSLTLPIRPDASVLPPDRGGIISLNADAISGIGLSQLNLSTSGGIDVAAGAAIALAPGGVFKALAGPGADGRGAVTIEGSITAPSGSIDITTGQFSGSAFAPATTLAPGDFDVVVSGELNVAGRWANDFQASADRLAGSAYLNGGEITLDPAARVTPDFTLVNLNCSSGPCPTQTVDVSGSILIQPGALLDLAGGGYVDPKGALTLTAKGGSLSLIEDTSYFQLSNDGVTPAPANLTGFRVDGVTFPGFSNDFAAVNPGAITARVSIADGAIEAHGFGGGGVFKLVDSSFSFGASTATSGAELPLDFFSRTGFATYDITTYATGFSPNTFTRTVNGVAAAIGGFNAYLTTDVATVGAGQMLSLTQSYFSPLLDAAQVSELQNLPTGSSLYSVLTPTVPGDAWDRKPVNLSLGGLTELHVETSGRVVGEAGGSLSVGELFNEGAILIPGGAVTQSKVLPSIYASPAALAVPDPTTVTAAQARSGPIYVLGDLSAGEGVRLAASSVTDLSGEALVNPRASARGAVPQADFVDGVVVGGGALVSASAFANGAAPFAPTFGDQTVYSNLPVQLTSAGVAAALDARPGARIDLAGAAAVFDRPTASPVTGSGITLTSYGPTPIWSDGGALTAGSGAILTGALINAQGGAPEAEGGTLTVLNPVLYQSDPTTPTFGAISANMVNSGAPTSAGFVTFIAQGKLSSVGDVTLTLPRALFVESPQIGDVGQLSNATFRDANAPRIGSGGALLIRAPYIALDGDFQALSTAPSATPGANTVALDAANIDIVGAVVVDGSVGATTLSATQAVRLIGVEPWQQTFNLNPGSVQSSLNGQLAVSGDLTIKAGQVYPATGSTFSITSAAAKGSISIEANGATPATPYSAGGDLVIQAATITQAGVLRVPLGALTLGSTAPDGVFAPATTTLTLTPGSLTSVSADGLSIPYGTTTDQTEWFFAPTVANPLTAPPAGVLHLAGGQVSVANGAIVDLKGGGDVYAYEFIPGTGGTRDVLDQFNPDPFSSNNGYQYPDKRQIYAIVPGLSNASIAAFDPIYSANFTAANGAGLYAPSQEGLSVYLNAAPGLAAGWYTLLPAQYAMLPGGMRVVQDTSAATPAPGGATTLADGTIVTSGFFGVAGANIRSATPVVFDVQSQSVVRSESNIALTSGDTHFAAQALRNGTPTPQLPIDAARLFLDPATSLALGAAFETAPAAGGRGAEVDISGQSITIEPVGSTPPARGGIVLTDADLNGLNAASLLIGGSRVDNADGTTSLDLTSNAITLASGATLTGPEIVLAVDGPSAQLKVSDGASIVASGAVNGDGTGDYIINGLSTDGATRIQSGDGGFVRVSDGPQRLVDRLNEASVAAGTVAIGAARLQGAAVEIESTAAPTLADGLNLQATSLALGASAITFGTKGPGLVLTPQLQALVGKAQSLDLTSRAPLNLTTGVYTFGDLTLDAPALRELDGGDVTLNSGALTFKNSSPIHDPCGGSNAAACGHNSLTISASSIRFDSGTVQMLGFGGSVTLNAARGVFVEGDATFGAGPAPLTLHTPYIGDVAADKSGGVIPNLTLQTTGAFTTASSSPASGFEAPAGVPGSSLVIDAASVAITGTELRATAGTLQIDSQTGISVSGGALLGTPGYAQTLGAGANATTLAAPGGLLSLTALGGDIAISNDSTLSVGGGVGQAGSLSLSAQSGQVYAYAGAAANQVALQSVFSASAPGSGASLTLDTGGDFDLSAFAAGSGQQFTGDLAIRTRAGDLTLGAGDTLGARSVLLTADGGLVDDAGKIVTAGPSGGDVALYGAAGVHLLPGAVIDAHANGYGLTDTRQAKGGDVTLGTDGTGAIRVDAGATLDVAALQTANRLVGLDRTNGAYYAFVPGDVGGTITLRAPVISGPGGDTVNVAVGAGAVDGAGGVVLEGFQRFDLGALASNPAYVGVSVANNVATLDLGAAGVGKINALADANGPVVQFVHNFDVSADYGALSGLAAAPVFHARPGIELDYSGNIVLASNWNLGAGVVNVAGAAAAGLMTTDRSLPGQYIVRPGDEAQIFSNYTTMVYRVGGAVSGEPGVLTLRAGGNLDLQGSITDGFFQFRDQTDPNYLNFALGGGARVYQGALAPSATCAVASCSVSLSFPTPNGLIAEPFSDPAAPYSAAANTPAARGSLAGGAGDPLGSAQLFPLIGGGTTPVGSWSYQLVAGADLGETGGHHPSADPLTVATRSNASVTVEGQHLYSYSKTKGATSFGNSLELEAAGVPYSADQWLGAFVAANPGVQDNSLTTIQWLQGSLAAKQTLTSLANTYFNVLHRGTGQLSRGQVTTTLSQAAQFMVFVSDHFSQLAPQYNAPIEPGPFGKPTFAVAPTLVRTGTGSIQVAAAGDIDLRNGATPVTLTGRGLAAARNGTPQLGGAAIYTAGHLALLGLTTATDTSTGASLSVDLGAGSSGMTDIFATDPQNTYNYGAGNSPGAPDQPSYAGIMIANPAYTQGGGSISLDAGLDVLGRRDTFLENSLGDVGSVSLFAEANSWIGVGNQPWRTGAILGDPINGFAVEARIDPQLFGEGVGALGGGDIAVRAGRNISDLSTIATSALTTASVGGAANPTAMVTLGGGDVAVQAGGDILGGRLDVASGQATVTAQGAIESAGTIFEGAFVPNTLRVRTTDATVDIAASGDVTLQGIAALGIYDGPSGRNSSGFYSNAAGVSILADGTVAVANSGFDVLTSTNRTNLDTASGVYPGSFQAVSLTGDVGIATPGGFSTLASEVLLYPSPTGTLNLFAGGDISPTTLAMLDTDPTLLPGAFSSFATDGVSIFGGEPFAFPTVLSTTTDIELRNQHNPAITHSGDPTPNEIVAGGDIVDVILSAPKQSRIFAGQDIVNMVFFGQNVASSDVTSVVAGRDITATTALAVPVVSASTALGNPLPAVQGDTFILGGPGSLFVEAGRDLGPFLTSAVTNGFTKTAGGVTTPSGALTFGNGIITIGNEWNPWLPGRGASIFTEFGVAKGENFAGLISSYLDPAGFATDPGYLFEQTTDATGVQVPDRSKEIYSLSLVDWMKSIAADVIGRYAAAGVKTPTANSSALIQLMQTLQNGGSATFDQALALLPQLSDQKMPLVPWMLLHEPSALTSAYGTLNVSYQQALSVLEKLPALQQQQFLINDVYFNELIQTSIPTSSSYLVYSRGYKAANTLFPAADGYTANSLGGGPAGASQTVDTGNLDLRLATIQTQFGGDISILGPGGRVLAGSTVSTSVQASRRDYVGGALYAGRDGVSPYTALITQIPVGYEGVITQRGGAIDSFTDADFLLNQSRAFTEEGGDIAIWSSNADVNAGQGPRTTVDVPPVVVLLDEDGFSQVNTAAAVSGAGIGALQPDSAGLGPSVFLIAPRGTVDAGAAGVRSAGSVFIAAFQVANADNIQASGTISGIQGPAAVNLAAQTSGDAASSAAAQAAQAAAGSSGDEGQRPLIFVDVLGFLADEPTTPDDDQRRRRR